jgi:hypothetical protein
MSQGPDSSDEELYAELAEAAPAVSAASASLPDVETPQEQPEAPGDFVFFLLKMWGFPSTTLASVVICCYLLLFVVICCYLLFTIWWNYVELCCVEAAANVGHPSSRM